MDPVKRSHALGLPVLRRLSHAWRTLMSLFRLRLKQENMILRWPGLKPSTMEGMERSRSARENRISSCALKRLTSLIHFQHHACGPCSGIAERGGWGWSIDRQVLHLAFINNKSDLVPRALRLGNHNSYQSAHQP